MKKFYYLIVTAMCMMFTTNISAQNGKNMVLHMKDKTTQKFSVAQIDSISFESEKPEEKAPFKVDLLNVSELYAEYLVTPEDPNMTYNIMCEPKEVVEAYENDEALFADDKLFFQELADGYGVSISEILEGFLITDEFNDFNTGLLPGKEYVMYLYGMTPQGEKTTSILKIYFKTKDVQKISNKIAIDAQFANNSISAVYTPDDNNLYYTAGLFAAVDVPYLSEIDTKLQQSISNIVIDYILGGEPVSNYLERSASKGQTDALFEGADPDEVYYVVAAYLDNECGVCSEVTVKTIGEEIPTKYFSRNRMMRLKNTVKNFKSAK